MMDTLKSQSNGPLYSNTVFGTLAVDGWAVQCYIWYSEEEPSPYSLYHHNSPPINNQCTNVILLDVALHRV